MSVGMGSGLDDLVRRQQAEIERLRSLLREALPAVASYVRKNERALRAAERRNDPIMVDKHSTMVRHYSMVRQNIDAALAGAAVQPKAVPFCGFRSEKLADEQSFHADMVFTEHEQTENVNTDPTDAAP